MIATVNTTRTAQIDTLSARRNLHTWAARQPAVDIGRTIIIRSQLRELAQRPHDAGLRKAISDNLKQLA